MRLSPAARRHSHTHYASRSIAPAVFCLVINSSLSRRGSSYNPTRRDPWCTCTCHRSGTPLTGLCSIREIENREIWKSTGGVESSRRNYYPELSFSDTRIIIPRSNETYERFSFLVNLCARNASCFDSQQRSDKRFLKTPGYNIKSG